MSLPFRLAPGDAQLHDGEVRVWFADLDRDAAVLDGLTELLTDDERARAAAFHFPAHGAHWVVSRATLRTILAHYLGLEPREVRFRVRPTGKPELAAPLDRKDVRFNISHSAGRALFALTRGRRVGVDIERVRPLPDLDALAQRACTHAERDALRVLPPDERLEAFFHCWTKKEAFVKAIGEGLAFAVDRVAVGIGDGAASRLEGVSDHQGEINQWTLQALALPEPGFAAAVAIEGYYYSRLECRCWTETVS